MAQVTIDEAMRIAVGHYQAGRRDAAEEICRQIVAQRPDQANALQLQGVLAFLNGQTGVAIELVGRAIASTPPSRSITPIWAGFTGYRGDATRRSPASAARSICAPGHAEAHGNLGLALYEQGRLDEAIAAYNRAIALRPDLAGVQNNLGVALRDQGRPDEAIAAYRRAIALKPDHAEAHNNLGNALWTRAGSTRRSPPSTGRSRFGPIMPRPITIWATPSGPAGGPTLRSPPATGRSR